jgi:hypothetical protein
MGVISSLTTKALHKIILWFAPINSESGSPSELKVGKQMLAD